MFHSKELPKIIQIEPLATNVLKTHSTRDSFVESKGIFGGESPQHFQFQLVACPNEVVRFQS